MAPLACFDKGIMSAAASAYSGDFIIGAMASTLSNHRMPAESRKASPRAISSVADVALGITTEARSFRCFSSQPAAAKVLTSLLDQLRAAPARGRSGRLAVVRAMSTKDPSQARS